MIAYGNPEAVSKMMHLCFYAQMYCQQIGLLTADVKPVGLTGLVTHLFWAEPENFAFCSLLQNRVFHEICTSTRSWESKAQSLLVVLSHLFEREPLHWTLQNPDSYLQSPSKYALTSHHPNLFHIIACLVSDPLAQPGCKLQQDDHIHFILLSCCCGLC